MRTSWILITVLLLVTLAATAVLMIGGNEIARSLHPEVFKLLATLVITAGIGGLASLVLNELNISRERREANRTLLRATLGELVSSYNEVKSVRRRLRAQALRPDSEDANAYVLRDPYESLLQRLNEFQLKLEAQVRLLEGNKAQYPEPKRLLKLLGDAESYLGKVTGEWEDRLGHFKEVPEQNKLADFVVLRCFVADAKQSFKPRFASPMEKVFSILAKAIGK
jgi:hypothetical protein